MNQARIINDLSAFGWAKVPGFTAAQTAEIVAHLKRATVYPDCHVRFSAGAPGIWEQYADKEVICHHNHDVLLAPHMLELALSLTDVAGAFLGVETPVLYSCNTFWTRPGPLPTRPDIQEFHVDSDDAKFLPLFIYLTDVGADGAQELRFGMRSTAQIVGHAGTAFFSDTAHPHRGLKPRIAERGICWWRWGVTENPAAAVAAHKLRWHAYVNDQIQPMPAARLGDRYPSDERLRRSIRLLVA